MDLVEYSIIKYTPKTHTKPIPPYYNSTHSQKTGNNKAQQANCKTLVISMATGNKIQKAIAAKNSYNIIGNDEVGSSNLPNSSTQAVQSDGLF